MRVGQDLVVSTSPLSPNSLSSPPRWKVDQKCRDSLLGLLVSGVVGSLPSSSMVHLSLRLIRSVPVGALPFSVPNALEAISGIAEEVGGKGKRIYLQSIRDELGRGKGADGDAGGEDGDFEVTKLFIIELMGKASKYLTESEVRATAGAKRQQNHYTAFLHN